MSFLIQVDSQLFSKTNLQINKHNFIFLTFINPVEISGSNPEKSDKTQVLMYHQAHCFRVEDSASSGTERGHWPKGPLWSHILLRVEPE